MAACTPTPTETLFTTSVLSTVSISTSISNQVSTTASTVTFTTTRCDVFNTTAGADPTCLSSTVVTSTAISDVLTTIPHTVLTSVPVFVTQTPPIRTLWNQCPDQPNTPDPIPSESDTASISSTTGGESTVIVTRFSTYTDSNGIHTALSTMTSSSTSLNQGGNGNGTNASLPGIIGGVVGGVLGLLAIIALIWYLLRRREQTRFMFDDDEDDMGGGKGGVYGGGVAGRRGRTRSVNLEDEIKGADAHPYQYGLVGNTPSPHGSPALHSQPSTMGYGTANGSSHHQRSSSRDALMASGPASPSHSPRHLDVLLPIGQRRASQLTGSSSGAPDSIMMTNQQPMTHAVTNNNLGNRPSDERDAPWMGHHARPSSSLLEAPTTYPPGHNGFYQQYGPIEPAQPAQRPPSASTGGSTSGGGMHKPALDPGLAAATRPVPAHQALYYAAGLSDPNSPLTHSNTMSSSRTTAHVMATPPPGAAGARQYPLSASTSVGGGSMSSAGPGQGFGHGPIPAPTSNNRESDLFSAVMASADHAAASATSVSPTPGAAPSDFGFGRQRRDGEKSPTPSSGPRSPVIQHRDGGRVPVGQPSSAEAPPPAYTDP